MGDFIAVLLGLNLSPVITILLAIVCFLVVDQHKRLSRVEKRNRKQDHAIWRIEQQLGLEPIPDDEEA